MLLAFVRLLPVADGAGAGGCLLGLLVLCRACVRVDDCAGWWCERVVPGGVGGQGLVRRQLVMRIVVRRASRGAVAQYNIALLLVQS